MMTVIQRVTRASVVVDGAVIGSIERGLLALVAVEKNDGPAQAERLAERILGYRVFPDHQGRMNLDVRQIDGGLLLVPQFTLAADTGKGTRPSFAPAAPPEPGRTLFDRLVDAASARHPRIACGRFGADMQVSLVNDGPVTFILRAAPAA